MTQNMKKAAPSVLLVGYNGANNTGSEARLLTIIEELRTVLGHDVWITVPTLNAHNLRRYIAETPTLRIAPVPSLYFFSLHHPIHKKVKKPRPEVNCKVV